MWVFWWNNKSIHALSVFQILHNRSHRLQFCIHCHSRCCIDAIRCLGHGPCSVDNTHSLVSSLPNSRYRNNTSTLPSTESLKYTTDSRNYDLASILYIHLTKMLKIWQSAAVVGNMQAPPNCSPRFSFIFVPFQISIQSPLYIYKRFLDKKMAAWIQCCTKNQQQSNPSKEYIRSDWAPVILILYEYGLYTLLIKIRLYTEFWMDHKLLVRVLQRPYTLMR